MLVQFLHLLHPQSLVGLSLILLIMSLDKYNIVKDICPVLSNVHERSTHFHLSHLYQKWIPNQMCITPPSYLNNFQSDSSILEKIAFFLDHLGIQLSECHLFILNCTDNSSFLSCYWFKRPFGLMYLPNM